ncbi:MAG TPA: hypothetical protein GX401_01015 [Clostridiales bacterium]|nr:hypothetical protein [Clostridiales bacterium]
MSKWGTGAVGFLVMAFVMLLIYFVLEYFSGSPKAVTIVQCGVVLALFGIFCGYLDLTQKKKKSKAHKPEDKE